MIRLLRTDSDNNDFINLIELLDIELWQRNQNRQKEYVGFNKIENLQTVVIAYLDEQAAGCGCFKEFDLHTAEIKRMFVPEKFRGKGISKLVLDELEKWAVELGYKTAILETGKPHFEAISLYLKSGYMQTENYGQYKNMPNSVCYRKNLVV